MYVENILVFFLTVFSTILLYNKEYILTGLIAIFALFLIYVNRFDAYLVYMILLFSFVLSVCTYIVVQKKICSFQYSKYSIPIWLPFCWMIVMMFAIFLTHKDIWLL